MATSARYTLIPPLRRTAAWEDGARFETGYREGWEFVVKVGALEGAATLDVVLEESLDGLNNWTELGRLTVSEVGETRLDADSTPSAPVAAGSAFLRARVESPTDAYTLAVYASAPFLNPMDTADQDLLPKQLREWEDGRVRTVEDAERDVLGLIREPGSYYGLFRADINDPAFLDTVRQAIARQAVHLMNVGKLQRATDTESLKLAGSMGALADGVGSLLRPFQPRGSMVWRGR